MTADSMGSPPAAGSDLLGLHAVVTGGASGIGLATVRALAVAGAAVTVLDLNAPDDDSLRHVPCDVTETRSVEAAVEGAAANGPGIDIVINNAGIGARGDVSANDDAEWGRVLDVNVLGVVRTTRAALPWLRRSRAAAVVSTCSVAAWTGIPQRALYSASKGAVQALTLAMAADHVGEGIRVNCVNPGTVDTPWVRRLLEAAQDPDAELAALTARQPLGRLVTAEEVAHAVCYLASPLSASTTGTILAVDGGMHALHLPPST